MKLLSLRDIRSFHDEALRYGGLQGESRALSLEAVIGRLESAYAYGRIQDEIESAAWYAYVIARGHPFNDANKRTAWLSLRVCLAVNEIDCDLIPGTAEIWMVGIADGTLSIDGLLDSLRDAIESSEL